jgi:hypothetical protein
MSAAPVRMKTVILYRVFNSPASAASAGYTIPVVGTRGSKKVGIHRFGKQVQVPVKQKTSTAEIDTLANFLGALGIGNSAAQEIAQPVLAQGQVQEGIDEDDLAAAMGTLGFGSSGGRKHKRKTHKRRHSKRRHTRRR